MPLLIYFLAFIFGLSMGSFLNSLALRYNTGEKVTKGRSRCFSCAKELSAWELVPVLSYLFLRGRCQSCKSVISWEYPAAEIFTGILFLAFFAKWFALYPMRPGILVYWLAVASVLVAVTLYDLRHKIIPDSFSYFFLALAVLGNLIFFSINLLNLILSLAPALFLLALWLFSRGRWMGLGDSKLMIGAGAFLGFPSALWALILAFWIGGALGIFLLLSRREITLKSEIPFGPFLVLGTLAAFFFQEFFMNLNIFYG